MPRFRFVHAADLHLDAPFRGLHARSPEIATRARDASLRAIDRLADLALTSRAAFVLLAGDIYDGPEHGVRAQVRFRRALDRLSAGGVQVFVVHGNHDPLKSGWSAIPDWPEGVTVFPADEVTCQEVRIDGEPVAAVHGISFGGHDPAENLARLFGRREDGPPFQIGLLHASVEGSSDDHEPYAPCGMDDLEASGLDYWALGHVHRRQELRREHCWVVYPGNTQGRSFKPSERGPKGATVVDVEDGRIAAVSFEPLDSLRFLEQEIDLSGVADLPALFDAFDGLGETLAEEHAGVDLAVRVRLVGRSPVHEQLTRPGAEGELLAELRSRRPREGGFLWWAGISDTSAPAVDLDEIRGRGDFAGELLRAADRASRSKSAASELVRRACGKPAALTEVLRAAGEKKLPSAEAKEIVERAALLALDHLLPKGGEPEP